MESKTKAQQGKEFMQQHSLTPNQREALILAKFERSHTYIQARAAKESNVIKNREYVLAI